MVVPAQERPPRAHLSPSGSSDFTAADFPGEPELQCDIVMKGGITSGVVYPLAVCELATTYRLRFGAGGAIAPRAIAAAAAAAAAEAAGTRRRERQPRSPRSHAAARLPRPGPVPRRARPRSSTTVASLLFHLFRPQPEAERLFGLLIGRAGRSHARGQAVTPQSAVHGSSLAVSPTAAAKAPLRSLDRGRARPDPGGSGDRRTGPTPVGSGALVVVTLVARPSVVGVAADPGRAGHRAAQRGARRPRRGYPRSASASPPAGERPTASRP